MKNGKEILIDAEDYPLLSQYKWHLMGKKYAASSISSVEVYMHRLLMSPPRGMVVDHIDGNPLNNQKSNLRICYQGENTKNCAKAINNKSGYKGVFWHKKQRRWSAFIRSDYGRKHLGMFDTKEEAARAYNQAAMLYHGEFARLNKI